VSRHLGGNNENARADHRPNHHHGRVEEVQTA
jgi:hypothetical protein